MLSGEIALINNHYYYESVGLQYQFYNMIYVLTNMPVPGVCPQQI